MTRIKCIVAFLAGAQLTVSSRCGGKLSALRRYGAVATLVRSAAPFSLYTPHTGKLSYDDEAPRIPAAAVTVEDADFLARVAGRGRFLPKCLSETQ